MREIVFAEVFSADANEWVRKSRINQSGTADGIRPKPFVSAFKAAAKGFFVCENENRKGDV